MRPLFWIFPLVALAFAAPAVAQTTTARPPDSRWELEVAGGLSLGRFTHGGRLDLPASGAPIDTSSPVFPSWRVPSWFFGDGAAFLNNVAAEFGVSARVTPLDARLRPGGLNDAGAPVLGFRVRRDAGRAYSVEFAVDLLARATAVNDALIQDFAATRQSFEETLRAILPPALFTGFDVSGTAGADSGSSREIAVTVSVNNRLRAFGRFVPYATVGGGVIVQAGALPSATLTARYRFRIQDVVPIDETDSLTLRYRQETALVLVAGGGVRRELSERMGLVIDARVLTGPNTTSVRAQASPTSVTGTPAGFVESFTYPNLQFSNNASTGRVSTLSGSLDDVEVFRGGWVTRGRVTAGLYFSF
jgi:hypothetical protein